MSYFSTGKNPHLIERVSCATMYFVLKISIEANANIIKTKTTIVQENAKNNAGTVGTNVIRYIAPTSR